MLAVQMGLKLHRNSQILLTGLQLLVCSKEPFQHVKSLKGIQTSPG
jgi:hypothetical protein